MSAPGNNEKIEPLDLSKWRNVPNLLMAIGGAACLLYAGFGLMHKGEGYMRQFGYSWLLAFMFFLSICLGGLFLTILHHLFDASWSVPVRRINEQLASLFPVMAAMFIPIAVLAPKHIFPWM